jgi:hypothetical protein
MCGYLNPFMCLINIVNGRMHLPNLSSGLNPSECINVIKLASRSKYQRNTSYLISRLQF